MESESTTQSSYPSQSQTFPNPTQSWENSYRETKQMSNWPWDDLVSMFFRARLPFKQPGFRVLELGCGSGANIPFFRSLQIDYTGIDASPSIIAQLKNRYPDLTNYLTACDFSQTFGPYDNQSFDLIFDRAAITHNSTEGVQATLQMIRRHLKSQGYFFGVHWFSSQCSDFKKGHALQDPYTRGGFQQGPFVGLEPVHFFERRHIESLLEQNQFEILSLEHITRDRDLQSTSPYTYALWNFVARLK